MSQPRSLRNPPHHRVDDVIGVLVIVAVFAVLLLCAVIGANR